MLCFCRVLRFAVGVQVLLLWPASAARDLNQASRSRAVEDDVECRLTPAAQHHQQCLGQLPPSTPDVFITWQLIIQKN
jgi:hypothetical protein